jgi:hypothetical protein
VRWNLSVVLICISFIARDVEHIFMYLLASCTFPFENSLLNSISHFFIGMLILWGWIVWVPCRLWIAVSYWMNHWQRSSPTLSSLLSDYFFCCAEDF